MADVKIVDEGGKFPEKRTLDLPNSINKAIDDLKVEGDSNKRPKVEFPTGINGSVPLVADENAVKLEQHVNAVATAEEDKDGDEDEEDCVGEQHEDANEEAGGKWKGIVVDRKGKGIMIEESDNDDSDDDDDDDSSDDSDSDDSDGLDESDSDLEDLDHPESSTARGLNF